jgi:hypothetical protein
MCNDQFPTEQDEKQGNLIWPPAPTGLVELKPAKEEPKRYIDKLIDTISLCMAVLSLILLIRHSFPKVTFTAIQPTLAAATLALSRYGSRSKIGRVADAIATATCIVWGFEVIGHI